MSDQVRKVSFLKLRAGLPKILRAFAVLALAATLVFIGVGFYRGRGASEFRMKSLPTQLSKDITAVVEGYERREADGDILKYFLKADKAVTFADNHQELENVYLEAYDESGEQFDKISAAKAIYIPGENKNFNAYFSGNVSIETRDSLKVKTEQLSYDREFEVAESEELIEFSRDNFAGKALGARVFAKEKRLELLKEVKLDIAEEDDIKYASISSGRANIEQNNEKATFEENVNVNIEQSNAEPAMAHAEKIIAHFLDKKINKLELIDNAEVSQKPSRVKAKYATAFFEKELKRVDLKEGVEIENSDDARFTKATGNQATAYFENGLQKAELDGNVSIETRKANEKPTNIHAGSAIYDRKADRFELKGGSEIITTQDEKQTVIRASNSTYEQASGKVFLDGDASITQGNDLVKGDNLSAELDPQNKLQKAFVRGNGYLRQVNERTTEVNASEMDAFFDGGQKVNLAIARGNVKTNAVGPDNNINLNGSDSLTVNFANGVIQKMNAAGNSSVSVIPVSPAEYTKATLSSPSAINLLFANGNISQMQSQGRTTIILNAPNNNASAANKKLIADSVKTQLAANGKDIIRAQAIGNAELYVEPLRNSAENYNTKISGSRFDCDFYEGNNAKQCTATIKTKAVRSPTIAGENRDTQTLFADKLNAVFNKNTQDIEQFDAFGNAKFNELDRTGLASQMSFSASDEVVRLRGGEPTVFDSSARAKAGEIDWDTKGEKTYLRGKVATTYYSQKSSKGSTPFVKANAPVFITAEAAQFDNAREIGVYTGNARAWQENNFVKADKLILDQKSNRMDGEGNIQSLLYDSKGKNGAKEPVFASANKIGYDDAKKYLRYEGNVDIRQGSDRLTGGTADVYLNENNELRQCIAQQNVVVTQPKRRAKGDFAQYIASEETFIMRGNPATIEDDEQGSSQGAQLSFNSKDKSFASDTKAAAGKSGNGRIRTVYKIKKP